MDARLIRWAGGAAVLGLVAACGGGNGTTTPPPQTGAVSGTVTASGSGVSGATVALPGKGTQTTSATGAFSFTQVAAGSHILTLTVPSGFELDAGQTAQKPVTVSAGQTATVGWVLRQNNPGTVTTETVNMNAATFSPSIVTVKAGSTIRWVNTQAILHTITPDGHTQWNRVETSATGEVLRVTINTPGEYEYHCEVHSGMNGEIVVQP